MSACAHPNSSMRAVAMLPLQIALCMKNSFLPIFRFGPQNAPLLKFRKILICFSVLAGTWGGMVASFAAELRWTEGFEDGIDSVSSYYEARDPQETLTLETDSPNEGDKFLRVTLPGNRALEGARLTAPVESNRMVTVTAMVRGTGEMIFCLNSQNGWLYSPKEIHLTGEWTHVSLSKTMGRIDGNLQIFFIGNDKLQEDAVFEIDNVQVELEPALEVEEVEVPPVRYDASQFSNKNNVFSDAEALNSKVVRAAEKFGINKIPFPQTSLPLTVYVRAKGSNAEGQIHIITFRGGWRQVVRTQDVNLDGQWQWIAIKNISVEEIGDALSLQVSGGVSVDSIVIATREDLDSDVLSASQLFGKY